MRSIMSRPVSVAGKGQRTGENREGSKTLPGDSLKLDDPDVLRLKAFWAFHDVELDRLAFLK
jgi:hypothetical protein